MLMSHKLLIDVKVPHQPFGGEIQVLPSIWQSNFKQGSNLCTEFKITVQLILTVINIILMHC